MNLNDQSLHFVYWTSSAPLKLSLLLARLYMYFHSNLPPACEHFVPHLSHIRAKIKYQRRCQKFKLFTSVMLAGGDMATAIFANLPYTLCSL